MEQKNFYITTSILYTSGQPHIGNIYEIILADVLARFKRFEGYQVRFQTGTDEHGLKIKQNAEAAGLSPQDFCDQIAANIQQTLKLVNIDYDHFQRTTDADHERVVSAIFKRMYEQGDIYKSVYEGWYCVPCESFFTDSQLEESGVCPDCGRELHREKEESYFFRLSNYGEKLQQLFAEQPDFLVPGLNRNEMIKNFLEPGLNDLAVSRRSFDWGVKTFDPDHVIYVWLDALFNYLTGLGYEVEGESNDLVQKFWPADLHVIGKDIARFHTIYWPAFLMSMDLPLPKQVYAHPWLLFGEGKMSKSRGNVIYTDDLVKVFGCDAVRYLTLREMPYDRDGHASLESLLERYNTDLANVFGNLFKRTLSMLQQYRNAEVRPGRAESELDLEIKQMALDLVPAFKAKVDSYHLQEALALLWTYLRRLNKYIDESEPWVLAKDPERSEDLDRVLFTLLSGIQTAAILLQAFMPETAATILAALELGETDYAVATDFGHKLAGKQLTSEAPTLFQRLKPADLEAHFKV
ncbi:MAG: methionine--tRNA ligase [Eubacteriales bacterium]|nr:methionine--tRNA ligase [Eubacteriales bacterium]